MTHLLTRINVTHSRSSKCERDQSRGATPFPHIPDTVLEVHQEPSPSCLLEKNCGACSWQVKWSNPKKHGHHHGAPGAGIPMCMWAQCPNGMK